MADRRFLIMLFIILFLFLPISFSDLETGTITGPESPSTVESIQESITTDINNNGLVDFSKEPYANNPEATLQALKKLYPNLDINSIQGVKIDGNTLTTLDGSKISLATGKPLTVETDGSKVTYFDDGEGTTCLNCEGLTYTSEGFKVGSGEKVDYYGFRRA